jgi:ribonuclease III
MKHLEELQLALGAIEKALDYHFKDRAHLIEAFIHRSYLNEHPEESMRHNERLEFLGDSALGVVISELLFKLYSAAPEGELSPLRARLIDAKACASYIAELKLESYLLMGKGEHLNQGRGRASLLSDLFEAIVGALYLDGGIKVVQGLIDGPLKSRIAELLKSPPKNYKALMQHYVQKELSTQPVYRVVKEEGLDHDKLFVVELLADDSVLGIGEGPSKKAAESAAAKAAFLKIKSS